MPATSPSPCPYLAFRDKLLEKCAQGKEPRRGDLAMLAILQKEYLAENKNEMAKERLMLQRLREQSQHKARQGNLACRRRGQRHRQRAWEHKLKASQPKPLPRLNFIPVPPHPWQNEMRDKAFGQSRHAARQAPDAAQAQNALEGSLVEGSLVEDDLEDDDLCPEDAAYLALSPLERNKADLAQKLADLPKCLNAGNGPAAEGNAQSGDAESVSKGPSGLPPPASGLPPPAPGLPIWTDLLDKEGKRAAALDFFGHKNPEEHAKAKQAEAEEAFRKMLYLSKQSGEWWNNSAGMYG